MKNKYLVSCMLMKYNFHSYLYLHLQNYKCSKSIFCRNNNFVDLKTHIWKKRIGKKYLMCQHLNYRDYIETNFYKNVVQFCRINEHTHCSGKRWNALIVFLNANKWKKKYLNICVNFLLWVTRTTIDKWK